MRRWLLPAALALPAALTLAGCGQSAPPGYVAEARQEAARDSSPAPVAPHGRIARELPPHPRPPYRVATPAQEAAAGGAAKPAARSGPPAKAEPPAAQPESGSPTKIPPASAGTNGSFVPPPPEARKAITPRTMAGLERREAEGLAISLNGIALAPPRAPVAIKAAIGAANEIVGRPYLWGGGHSSWYSRGYDCSGAVSYALGGGGFLSSPLSSGRLASWGEPGPGRWLTVYANGGHAYAVIAGLRFDTVGDARGSGPRWHPVPVSTQGFIARHPPGY